MKVLVIDDLRTFHFGAIYARTVAEARTLLFGQFWDEVWLDYDMGLTVGADTLRPLMLEIDERTQNGEWIEVDRFVIHTANPNGRMAMRQVLLRHGYTFSEVDANDYLAPGETPMYYIGKVNQEVTS